MYNARGLDRCADDLHNRSFLASATRANSDAENDDKDTEAGQYISGVIAC